jgi:hypothetical protein
VWTFHQPECPVGDRAEQRVVDDPLEQVDRFVEHLVSTRLDEPARSRPEVLVQVAGRIEHVSHVLQGEVAVGEERGDDGLGHHPDQQDALPGEGAGEVEEPVEQVAAEHVAGHVPRRWHPLQGGLREQLTGEQCVGELEPERVREVRVDLERVTEAELPVCEAGLLGEVLVEQLAHRDGVRFVDGVGGGEVVVLAGVDDDARPGVHLPAEPLVDEGAHRVDVAEQDPVHRVVEHHVEALEPGQRGDLRHAQPGRVVGQADVAAELARHLVESGPHQPEVLLGGVGAGVPLPGRPLRHVVEKRLTRGADDGDDIGALPGRGLGLRNVLVDVAGGHDQVDPGLPGSVPDPGHQPVAFGAAAVDGADPPRDRPGRGRGRALRVPALGQPEVDPAGRGLGGEGAEVRVAGPAQGVPDRQRDPVLEPDVVAHRVGEPVDPRDPVRVGAGEPGQPQHRSLDGGGGVGAGHGHDGPAGLAGQDPGPAHGRGVQIQQIRRSPGGRRHECLPL